jgi:uncharacterized RDD family membrane protein YckC
VNLSEPLRIDTPEQVALELPVAGLGSRFLALALDTLLQGVLYFLVFVLLMVAGPRLLRDLPAGPVWSTILPAIGVLLLFCIYWGYFAIFEIVWQGQTPGKRLVDIRVIRDTGRPVDPTAAILRNLLRAVDFLPALYGVGVVVMVLNRNSRRLGDYVAGTVVVHEREASASEPGWSSSTMSIRTAPQSARLSNEELVLIETYLERRWNFTPEVRENRARQIAARISQRTGLQPDPGHNVDDFLEAVARQARDAGRLRSRQP